MFINHLGTLVCALHISKKMLTQACDHFFRAHYCFSCIPSVGRFLAKRLVRFEHRRQERLES